MNDIINDNWIARFEDRAASLYPSSDPSHDLLHIRRVVRMARLLAAEEGADADIVIPAAYFHDCVNVPKNDPRRSMASRLSADAAVEWLRDHGYPAHLLDAIAHAIAAHSFSAGITPETIEAKVVQDADRLDGLGAVGIARCFTVSGLLQRPYYDAADPFASERALDDGLFAIDHFEVKLFKTAQSMNTASAKIEAQRRGAFMRDYLAQLRREIG
jgi:uncharacterized protein